MIRSQQTQLQQLQQQQQQQQPSPQASASGTAVIDEASSTPQADLGATAFPIIPPLPAPRSRTSTLSSHRPSRRSSQVDASSSSHAESGAPGGGVGTDLGPRRSSRDESAFYQAEAAMLSRENQMLRQRIRDLGEFFLSFFFFSYDIYSLEPVLSRWPSAPPTRPPGQYSMRKWEMYLRSAYSSSPSPNH